VFDYLFVRRMRVDIAALYDPKGPYRYWAGFNPVAIAWTAIGCLICSFVIPVSWLPAPLTALITGAGYALTVGLPEASVRIAKRKP
jgi:NCS1 family nucleobase:cation symporter-1